MMWLLTYLMSLGAAEILNLLSAALCFALVAGVNDRLGALIAGLLALAMVLV
jgi:hypothetical protein